MSNVNIVKFLFRTEVKVLNDALNLKTPYESKSYEDADQLLKSISENSGTIIISSLKDKNDLIQIATFAKLAKKIAKNAVFKIMVMNFSGDRNFEKAIARLGISDFIELNVQSKALRFKIDFVMKTVAGQMRQLPPVGAAPSQKSQGKEDGAPADKKYPDHVPLWTDGIDCEDDIWLLKTEQDCKKVLSKWLVKFMGPSPYVASWADSGTPGVWRFDFKDENQVFVSSEGAWFFKGDQKPDFIWSENNWLFTGMSYELFFKAGDKIIHRLKSQDRVLTIAKNSVYAKTKTQKIIDSFNKEVVIKRDAEGDAGEESIDKDAEFYQNLQGKGKTDNLKSGPLAGKGKTSNINHANLAGNLGTSHLNTDPMGMNLNPGDNNLSSDPLSQAATKNQKHPSFWEGELESSEEDLGGNLDGPASEALREGQDLSMEPGSAKVNKFYKNHNEAEKYDAKDIGHALTKDGVADNLHGKTDPQFGKKDDGDLSGEGSSGRVKGRLTSPNLKKEHNDEEKGKDPYGGRSSTDKIDGHLSSANSDKKQKDVSDKKHPALERGDAEKQNGAGKSSTDKINGHLFSPPQEKKDAEASGKTGPGKSLDELAKTEPNLGAPSKNKLARPAAASSEIADDLPDNVLPFTGKDEDPFGFEEELPKDLEEAVQSAKVLCFLSQGDKKVECKLDDYFDESIMFSTQSNGLEADAPVFLTLNFNYLNKDTILKFDGILNAIETDDEGTHYLTVEINPENEAVFKSFMKLYQSRQKNINLFMKTAKGY